MAVNKVQYGNTTIMDITDTTADSNDVIDGEVFYTASGTRSVGTLGDATQSTHGLMSTTDKVKLDGITAGANKPVFLTYGSSTWSDAITAYNNGAQLYCLASTSIDTPESGTMNRIAQLVYVAIGSGTTVPYQFEFQYFRSTANKTISLLSDQILVYKLDQNDGWSFSYRYVSIGEVSASNGITASYNNDILSLSGPGVMTGATSSTAGTSGSVPAPTTSDVDKFLAGDGTYKSGGLPMVILSYGNSTWADFIAAYNNNVIVYCRASSQSNPATGSQTRMAFMAYVNNADSPTEVEFQYYRSVSSHSASQMGDQVYVYKLNKTNGWSVTTREASIKEIKAGTSGNISVSWSSNKVTINGGLPAVTASDNGKILQVVNGAWALVTPS